MGKNRGSQAMRLHKKQQEQKEKERQQAAQAFIDAYTKIVKEHGIEWTCELVIMPGGITPRLRLKETKPAAVITWPEAQRQNLETRKECTHNINKDTEMCKLCGLEKENWGVDAKGVLEEYEVRKRKEIEEAGEPKEPKSV